MTTTTIILSLLGVIGYIVLIVFIVRDAGYEDEWGNLYNSKDWRHLKRQERLYH